MSAYSKGIGGFDLVGSSDKFFQSKKKSYPVRLIPQGLFVARKKGESITFDWIGADADWKCILGSYLDRGCRDVFFACFDYADT